MSFVIDALQIAHDIGVPHTDPAPPSGSDGGASPIIIIAGVLLSLALVGALVWLKKRADPPD
jgi:hypothetical protein